MKGHIHILGICGTFMGGIALLARELGFRVTGSDASVYPPMSTQLRAAGIDLMEGYLPEHLHSRPDCVVVGNAMTRGNPLVECPSDLWILSSSFKALARASGEVVLDRDRCSECEKNRSCNQPDDPADAHGPHNPILPPPNGSALTGVE